jgi:DNA modification methylase
LQVIEPTILQGHVLDVLKSLPSESVHCCVTSPPYLGLRSYGTNPQVWGGEKDCQHEWVSYVRKGTSGGTKSAKVQIKGEDNFQIVPDSEQAICAKCGSWKGELGSESDPEMFIAHLVEVFREVRRVLRKDGTLYVNMGDSFTGSGFHPGGSEKQQSNKGAVSARLPTKTGRGMKAKDLMEIPSMLAQALREDGWYLRARIPWLKVNALPESVQDRPTCAVEYFFMLTKNKTPFYDLDAVRTNASEASLKRIHERSFTSQAGGGKDYGNGIASHRSARRTLENFAQNPGRSRRNSDWFMESLDCLIEQQRDYLAHLEKIKEDGGLLLDKNKEPLALIVNTQGFPGSHFATFNPRLIEPLIKASTSEKGCCPKCGAPWMRVVEKTTQEPSYRKGNQPETVHAYHGESDTRTLGMVQQSNTIGWEPSCKCYGTPPLPKYPHRIENESDPDYEIRIAPIRTKRMQLLSEWSLLEVIPCTILDPFAGSGTTLLVSTKLGRRSIGIELNPQYVEMIKQRCSQTAMAL